MSRKTGLALLLITTTACAVVLSVTTWTLQERVYSLEAQVGQLQIDVNLLPKVEESALAQESLIKVAGGEEFVEANKLRRIDIIKRWCEKKLPPWKDLNEEQQELLLFRLESQLDDLLAERDFETPKA